ncbi:[FeFe] hydrogenase H-cluster maturation GTPase HydF [Halothermothrix orenii]|uniref:Small GTP-binding protein n=1 Tax=Halothermothrix orenii (strain H 168 / OCM 544 / DSM 9562) TaxID=373903 RepID=B8CZF9_HALOH|nr:[FeFe] hydrogenase H-cluster maturation GTPase HydF [Halothermothrix orenii]ACL70678.1 small GTP-binding protein [Halothermothrix orenii H 168]
MQQTPRANRPHIAVFGRRNVGKSTLINTLTNQELALVSDVPGTTTDPVYKSMELLPLGPVVMIDTAGIDDVGSLGKLRIKKTREVIRRTDLAILVIDPFHGAGNYEKDLYNKLQDNNIPVVVVINKIDRVKGIKQDLLDKVKLLFGVTPIKVSAHSGTGIEELREVLVNRVPRDHEQPHIIGDLIDEGDTVILVTPIDSAAPKGRLILPQVQTLRDILDNHGMGLVVKETELEGALKTLREKPRLVVTDSQVFGLVSKIVPEDIYLTGFSILFARYKGDLMKYLEGVAKLENLRPGDKILIAEACTHRRQPDDIGTVKLPGWIRSRICNEVKFDLVSGREYPDNLEQYDLVLHCAGCMLNRKEVLSRLKEANTSGVPVVNYGMAIAYLHGILDRALKPFGEAYQTWKGYRK